MTLQDRNGRPGANSTTRVVVASYPEYAGAQYAVDALSDQRFPVDRLAIVGAGLQSFEQVTGRKGYGKAADDVLAEADVADEARRMLAGTDLPAR